MVCHHDDRISCHDNTTFQVTNTYGIKKKKKDEKRSTTSKEITIFILSAQRWISQSSVFSAVCIAFPSAVCVIGLRNMNNYIYTIIYAKELTALKL